MQRKLLALVCFYITSLVVCNVISVKLLNIGGLIISAGILTYSLTFLFLNVITEVWGKKTAADLVWAGLLINLFSFAIFKTAAVLPAASFFNDESFRYVLDCVPRIILACNIAFIVSQYQNIWTFSWVRKKTGAPHLWLRNNTSTITSQFLDCSLFYLFAFAPIGLTANEMPWGVLFGGMLVSYILKVVIAILDTPFCYLLVSWAKNERMSWWPELQDVPVIHRGE
jgi:uncharacterized integral membrane protein (TIGR00697 family)